MRLLMTAGFAASALAVGFACDPFPDVDALGGGDGGTSAAGDGGGGVEAGGGDGASAADAGGDADGGGRFCSQATHAFCADLDGDEPLATQWSEVEPGVAIVSSPVASGAGALHITLPKTTNNAADVVLRKSLDVPAANVTLSFDAYWVKPSWSASDGNVFLASLDVGQAHFYLWIDRSDLIGISSNSPDFYSVRAQTGELADRRWTHVVFVVTPLSSKTQVISLGTPPAVAVSQTVPMDVGGSSAKGIQLTLGLFVTNTPTPPLEIYYDDVTVDISN